MQILAIEYIDVLVKFNTQGDFEPVKIKLKNNKTYLVDRVYRKDIRKSLKVGGQGLRFYCRISGKDVYLFFDENKWFLEGI